MAKYKKRKDGRYSTTILVGKKPDGTPIKHTVYGKTVKELDANKAKVMVDLEQNVFVKDRTMTFGIFARKWLDVKKIELSNASIDMYERRLKKELSVLNDKRMIDICFDDLQSIITANKHHPTTAYKIKITLDQIFEAAVVQSIVYKSPAVGLVVPQYISPEQRVVTKDEFKALDEAELTPREECFIRLVKNYGLRKEEALALRTRDFIFSEDSYMNINKAVEFPHNQPLEKPTKTGHTRMLYLMRRDEEFFRNYISAIDADEGDDHLFKTADGKRWITNISYRHMFDSIKRKCGFDEENDISAHKFRHTFITDCYHAGLKLKDTQYMAGHSTVSVTLGIYTHLDERSTERRDILEVYKA